MRTEYAVRNPYSGKIMTVPDNSRENAEKMAGLVPDSAVMRRDVSVWEEVEPWPKG